MTCKLAAYEELYEEFLKMGKKKINKANIKKPKLRENYGKKPELRENSVLMGGTGGLGQHSIILEFYLRTA